MKHAICVAFVLSSAAALSSCAVDTVGSGASDDEFSPGYTAYTVTNADYVISNGYGPSFWSPRYYYYTGYNHDFYGRYDGGYARGGHGGYHR
jgi:hypothetical protein